MANLYGSNANPIVEVLIDGVWTDVTSRVRNGNKISITRGRADEQSRVAPQRAQLSFDNEDGFFSTRLPSSVNYRKIGKNTQIRILAGRGDNYLRAAYNDTGVLGGATTADKVVLDITGDIDIRAEIWPHSWRSSRAHIIVAKYSSTGDQRSWALRLNGEGKLILNWSTTGTIGTTLGATSVAIPVPAAGRLAVRATLDVDNGAGSRVITFYTSDSITGTWTVLGTAITQAGTTSIFNSTAVLAVGRGSNSASPFASTGPFGGKTYRVQLRNGIGGTLVADFNATAQALGTTTWSDGLGTPNTWTLDTGAGTRITSDRVRFWGELASLPKEWDRSGRDVIVPARAAGMLQRLGQGVKPLDSAMVRNFKGLAGAIAWWPLEDDSTATMATNAASGTSPRSILYTGKPVNARFADTKAPPGAKSSLAFSGQDSRFFGKIDLRELGLVYNYSFYIKIDALPASSKVFYSIDFAFGARIDVALSGSGWDIGFYDFLGNVITTNSTAIGLINPVNGWVGYQLQLTDNGAGAVSYLQRWDTIGTFGGGMGPVNIPGYTLNPPTYIRFTAANDPVYSNLNISHIRVDSTSTFDMSNPAYRDASNAYRGETAAARLVRLSTEEGVPMEITGLLADSEPMGYQTLKAYPDLVSECWEVDGGIGGEARDALTLEYRTRADMEAREDLVLSHDLSDLADVPRPTDDDQGFTNDVTVTRTGGSSARSILTEGYTSIADPPAGVGRYNTDVTLNMATDDRLFSVSGWLALVGSWDQDRYPEIAMALHRARLLADDTLFSRTVAARLGDTVTIADLPAWMPPDRVPQLIQGYTEQLSKFLWEISFNASPAGPYQAVPALGSDVFPPRLDAVAHTLGGALTTTATSVSFVTPTGSARWVDSAGYAAEFPFEVVVGGEVIRVTAISGTTSPQTATLVRSVNGVVKAHSSGAAVRLARPFYIGR